MKMIYVYITSGLLIIFISIYEFRKKNIGGSSTIPIPKGLELSVADFLKNNYFGLAFQNSNASSTINQYVTSYDIISIIGVESGALLYKGIRANDIKGDGGNAYGIMQIHNGALTDVNISLGSNYSMNDILNPAINIKVGARYLDLCYRQAVKENSTNIRFLAYRKYNGGIGRAKDGNKIALGYATKVNNFRKLL